VNDTIGGSPVGPPVDLPTVVVAPAAHPSHVAKNRPLALLAALATIWILHWAQVVLIPILLGVLISYALSPVINALHHWRIPRAVGAALLLLGMLGGLGTLAFSLSDDAVALVETLPAAAQNLRKTLRKQGVRSRGAIDQMQQAASQLERAANETGPPKPATPGGVTRVQIEKPALNVQDFLWTGTRGVLALAGQAGAVMFLVYFLLAAGDTFRRKLVRITGPVLSKRKITVRVLDEITSQIQRYLLVQIATSVLVGVVTWLALALLGLEHAAIWGVAAAVFNNIPYVGPVVVSVATTLVALLQFGSLQMALLVGGVVLLITSLEGNLLTPWLTSRASRMNAVAVFISLLLWGWLWGVWGLLLGLPIMVVGKAVCDRVEDFQPVGELLGE
jgi:predicted PurR-regulated permease PerM